jgi:hypothetical protein
MISQTGPSAEVKTGHVQASQNRTDTKSEISKHNYATLALIL